MGQPAILQLDDLIHHHVEQVAVVGDDDDRSPVAADEPLQKGLALQVEVVVRLVEQEQVGLGDQQLCQADQLFLAAAEHLHRQIEVGLGRTPGCARSNGRAPRSRGRRVARTRPAAALADPVRGSRLARRHRRLGRPTGPQRGPTPASTRGQLGRSGQRLLPHGAPRRPTGLLAQIADGQVPCGGR